MCARVECAAPGQFRISLCLGIPIVIVYGRIHRCSPNAPSTWRRSLLTRGTYTGDGCLLMGEQQHGQWMWSWSGL